MAKNITGIAFDIVCKAAPERSGDLKKFRQDYPVPFVEVCGRVGITLNANRSRIEYSRKDLQVIWLLSFSLWRSVELFSPAILLSSATESSAQDILTLDQELDEIERDYRERIGAIIQIINSEKDASEFWPPDIPKPFESRDDAETDQDKAVFDLVMMATAVAFLHELRHVKFHVDHHDGITRPGNRAEEELLCDVHAREWFLAKAGDYATDACHDYQAICSKRGIALIIICEFLRIATDHAGEYGSADYPPIDLRIAALSDEIKLPDFDKFWVVSGSILLGEVRRRGIRSIEIPKGTPKSVSKYLSKILLPDAL
ncbi:MAG: hypothetical protein KDA48_04305 [Amphiplicatus sp.]|nr:hypothetical protein [Amphiplicatus sp.]